MNSSGMDHSGMGQMDHAQMMQHCRVMMQGQGSGMGGDMTHGGSANSGGMGQMDHAQMMQHCRAMMQSEGGTQPTR
jgi:23S rRNA U2552 (ribose-2'-O)-methylase RlmE/FtsJ